MPPADTESLNLLQDVVNKAIDAGGDAADAVLFTSVALSHAQRLGKTEKLERAETADLGLRVLVGQRQAIVSSTDQRPDAPRTPRRRACVP